MSDILLQQKTDDGILILTLNRPDAMNCFNFDLLAELADVIREANFDMESPLHHHHRLQGRRRPQEVVLLHGR